MKKLYLMLSMLFAFGAAANAVPAKKWLKVLTLANGSQVTAELCGDEYLSWWQGSDGKTYRETAADEHVFEAFDLDALKPAAAARRARNEADGAARLARAKGKAVAQAPDGMHRAVVTSNPYTGKKKGLVVLVDFKNKKFEDAHDLDYYKKVVNGKNFTMDDGQRSYIGSVRDYFYAQSNGQLDVEFDVVGPVTMSQNYGYYGQDSEVERDVHKHEMFKDALDAISTEVNFADYDWDGDGEVEQVFFLYAGRGQANGGATGTIWPHKSMLQYYACGKLKYSTGTVNVYACAQELQPIYQGSSENMAAGIGTICHEYSHCLGFADMYDTNGQAQYGMSVWDLMDQGSYNNDGFTPCNYTGFERIYAGWVEPIELEDPATVKKMLSSGDYGRPFVISNMKKSTEYFVLENRQLTGWDAGLPNGGLLITHVDYDLNAWNYNTVNASGEKRQRCTILQADGSAGFSNWADLQGDVFPYESKGVVINDEFTDDSEPAAKFYNKNSDGSYYAGVPLTNIKRNADGTISFLVMDGDDSNVLDNTHKNPEVNGIGSVEAATVKADHRIFSIDGRYLGTDASRLGKGIYVIGGKKIVK